MLHKFVLAIAWSAAPTVEPFSRAFWIHQAMAAVMTLAFLRWLTVVADRRPRARPTNLLRFPGGPAPTHRTLRPRGTRG